MEEENEFVLNGLEPYEPIPKDLLGKVLLDSLMRDGNENDALEDASTGATLSYKDILQKSCNLAEALRIYGTGSDSIHAICSENNIEYYIPVLACLYLGCKVVPLNHHYTQNELNHVLELTQPSIIFCSQAVVDKIVNCQEKYIDKIIVIDSTSASSGAETLEQFMETLLNGFSVSPQNIQTFNGDDPSQHVALILSSSGTTGLPKGVMITHEMILVRIAQSRHPQMTTETKDVVVLGLLPFFHSYGMAIGITAIVNREKLVIVKRFESKTFLGAIQDHRITSISLAPPILNFLATTSLLDDYDFSSVVEVFCGGAPMNGEMERILMKRLNISTIRQIYGLTETIAISLTNPGDIHKPGASGKVVPYMKMKVIDPGSGKSLGPNQQGEIYVKGPVMKGYYNNQQATRESFTQDGWLRCGDIGYYDEEGYIFIVDRLKELIKYKAYQVAPAELEAILINHSKVLDAGVVGVPDDEAGELPLAFVVKQNGIDVTEKELQNYVAEKVSPQKRLRGGIIFVAAIPRNAGGKILRRELRKTLANFIAQHNTGCV